MIKAYAKLFRCWVITEKEHGAEKAYEAVQKLAKDVEKWRKKHIKK